jgi:molecular chaperone IbpA
MTLSYGKSLLPTTVGFDRLLSTFEEFDRLQTKPQTYPPYNLVKDDDSHWTIEIAIAGFKKEEIDITFDNSKLIVSGAVLMQKEQKEYHHQGIAKRDFSHKFTLAETVVVKGADIVDGVLVIKLENVIPEDKKPQKIQIGINSERLLTR